MGKGKKTVNRMLSCVLCIALILSGIMILPAQVQAETVKEITGLGVNDAKETDYAGISSEITVPASLPVVGDDGFEYIVLEDGTIEVTGYKGTETELVIPSQIDGKPVTSIGECFAWGISNSEAVTAITIPDTVTRIKTAAFLGLGITSVTIPKGVKEINNEVFSGCANLKNVILPEGVTKIGRDAFSQCSSLEGITIPDSVTSIGDSAFYLCTSLKSITIPEGVTSIGISAFQDCSSLESVTIPESMKELGEWAFALCESLTSVTIPAGVASIESMAFAACSNLQSIIIPEGVTSIGEGAFYNCDSLTNVIIPDGVTSIGDGAFGDCSDLESVEIPGTVTDIGEKVFESCPEDMVVYVEAGSAAEEYVNDAGITTETIPAKDISGATGDVLTSYTYDGMEKTPKGNDLKIRCQGDVLDENVDYQILEYKNNLYAGTASVILKGIGKYNGQLLVEFEIAKAAKPPVVPPESVRVAYSSQTVGACTLPKDWKWDEKDALEALEVEVPVKATACYDAPDKDSYEQTSFVITITRSKCEHVWDAGTKTRPATIESTGEILYTCQVCKETKKESVDKLTPVKKGDKRQDKKGTANYIVTKVKGKKVEVAYTGMIKASKKVTIPSEVILSDGTKAKVTSIANKAFYGCKTLTHVTIGKNVNKIGSKAFYGCSKLKKLTIKSTKLTKKKIGSKAFSKTPKKMSVQVPKKKFKAYKAMLIKKGVNKKAKFKKN